MTNIEGYFCLDLREIVSIDLIEIHFTGQGCVGHETAYCLKGGFGKIRKGRNLYDAWMKWREYNKVEFPVHEKTVNIDPHIWNITYAKLRAQIDIPISDNSAPE